MPHLTLEYTNNLAFDTQSLLTELQEALVASGAVARKGLKSRAVRLTDYLIADGSETYAFVHLNLLIREGRPFVVQQDLARRAMAVLENRFGERYDSGYLSLSVHIEEMKDGIAITRHNIPAR